IDNLEVRDDKGANLIANGTFENGITGWTAEGTMAGSALETTEGFQSTKSLHLRALDRGDNQVNRVRCALVSSVRSGTVITIKAQARWLRGAPTLLLRIRGSWMEAPGSLNLPVSAGTPGIANSHFQAAAPPGIREVTHAPILPADSQAVRITARISALGANPLVRVNYRLDPATTIRTVTMTDDGTGGDAVAGDGLYTATLPGQLTGTLLAYTVTAQDTAAGGATSRYPAADATGEALIRFGEQQPAGNIPTYRFWVTQANFNAWSSRSKLNNTPLDCTFVLGNQRVIHNTVILYAGSPYIAPGYCGPNCGRCGYSVTFPDNDLFLGSADMVLDWPGGHGNESTALQEQMAYWMAGKMALPTCYRYPIRLHLNGVTDDQRGTIFEAVNQPASEFLKAWMPNDSNGDFFKVDRAFEFNDGGSLVADPPPTLQVFTTTGGAKKAARYRWNWNKRAGSDPNNYTNIFDLVDAVNAAGPEPYTSQTEALVDVEEWMGIFATEHIINNFDSWGHDIGKNMYAYKPRQGKWQIYMFDLDWLMLAAPAFNSTYTAKTGPLFECADPVVSRMYAHPPFRRAYFRAIQRAVAGPLRADQYEPQLAARYASYVANGVRFCDGQNLTAPDAVKTWFNDRRVALQAQLDRLAVPFAIAPALPASSASSPLTVTGSAPIQVESIQVNGVAVAVTWTSVTNWSARVPLVQATNALTFTAADGQGVTIPGLSASASVRYTGVVAGIPPVFINEWMADNATFIADHAGGSDRFSDWFELFNAGSTAADLTGYYLTDTLSQPDQFQIPSGYAIPAGGRLLVWADNLPNLNSPDVPDLHVNFKLAAAGEAIGLFAPDGTPVDTVTFGLQMTDVSEGRSPDGGPTVGVQATPTPGAANVGFSLRLDGHLAAPGTLHLEWGTVVGLHYVLESAATVDSGTWTALMPPVAGDGSRQSFDVSAGAGGNQFIRLRVVP
ncbi:MAG TPA: CotH kinase family protein, partial [Candidatus Limnocylindria bacterium]|nr:CotH kinase family protein [Candidatus Limnocylindria bacterium]